MGQKTQVKAASYVQWRISIRFGAVCRGSSSSSSIGGVDDPEPLWECPQVSVRHHDLGHGTAGYQLFVTTGNARIDKIVFLIHFDANITDLRYVRTYAVTIPQKDMTKKIIFSMMQKSK
jgi:hypothetical protein